MYSVWLQLGQPTFSDNDFILRLHNRLRQCRSSLSTQIGIPPAVSGEMSTVDPRLLDLNTNGNSNPLQGYIVYPTLIPY